jgi:hypothetical protein
MTFVIIIFLFIYSYKSWRFKLNFSLMNLQKRLMKISNLIDHEYIEEDSFLISRRFMQKYFFILNMIGKFELLNMSLS